MLALMSGLHLAFKDANPHLFSRVLPLHRGATEARHQYVGNQKSYTLLKTAESPLCGKGGKTWRQPWQGGLLQIFGFDGTFKFVINTTTPQSSAACFAYCVCQLPQRNPFGFLVTGEPLKHAINE